MIVSPKNTRDTYLQSTGTRYSSNSLSIEEKPSITSQYNNILSTRDVLVDESVKFGITTEKNTYNAAVNALTTFLATLTVPVIWNNLNNITFVARTTFDQKFIDVLTAETALRTVLNSRGTIEAYLTVPAISMTADSSGIVSGATLSTSGGTFKVFAGITEITSGNSITYSVMSNSGCTVSVNSSTGVYVPISISQANANATIRAQLPAAYGNISVDRVFSVSKVNTGSPGPQGNNGTDGTPGSTGAQARIAYILINGSSLNTSPSSVTVSGDSLPSAGSWGSSNSWQTTAPTDLSAGQSAFQSNGLYSQSAGQTVWGVPYLSNLKVGALSVITTETGTLTIGSAGHLKGGQTAYNTGNGFWQGYDLGIYKMSIGTADNSLTYDGDKLVIDVYGGYVQFGKTGSSASILQINRDTSTTLPAVSIFDTSTSLSEAFYVTNSSSFTGSTMVGLRATKGEALRATTDQSTQYSSVFQNLGSGRALSVAGLTYSGYAGIGNGAMKIVDGFLPFTGIHISMIDKDSPYSVGDIVRSVEVLTKKDISNTLLRVEVVNSAKNKAVFGVINGVSEYENYLDFDMVTWYKYQELYTGLQINGVGEGCVNVCGLNGDIETGDLITSSNIAGKGMKQDDDIVRSYTVAKSTEDVTFDFPEQVKQISCTYMCG